MMLSLAAATRSRCFGVGLAAASQGCTKAGAAHSADDGQGTIATVPRIATRRIFRGGARGRRASSQAFPPCVASMPQFGISTLAPWQAAGNGQIVPAASESSGPASLAASCNAHLRPPVLQHDSEGRPATSVDVHSLAGEADFTALIERAASVFLLGAAGSGLFVEFLVAFALSFAGSGGIKEAPATPTVASNPRGLGEGAGVRPGIALAKAAAASAPRDIGMGAGVRPGGVAARFGLGNALCFGGTRQLTDESFSSSEIACVASLNSAASNLALNSRSSASSKQAVCPMSRAAFSPTVPTTSGPCSTVSM